MEILSFFGGVWASIIFGVFAIAMVVSCSFDRSEYVESPKWWTFSLFVVVFGVFFLPRDWAFSWLWQGDTARRLWGNIGIYLGIGLCYSILEFALDVRRSARFWAEQWAGFKSTRTTETRLVSDFISSRTSYGDGKYYHKRIIGVQGSGTVIEPKINRQQLAESIGVWTMFWPFYAISLIVGDLLTEVFRVLADMLVGLSGRFVRAAFKDVFKA